MCDNNLQLRAENAIYIGHDGQVEIYLVIAEPTHPTDQDVIVKRWADFDEEMPIWLIKENITHLNGRELALNWLDALRVYIRARH